eukprot:scaffold106064_cov25-Attheya_sp.AAC.1
MDAVKPSFRASVQIGERIHYEYRQWSSEVSERTSSNWKELANIVEAVDQICLSHDLRGCEFFIFTDNTTAERAYWKGTSRSETLFNLVLRLRKLEMRHDIVLHVIHVSGKRMIEQGTDGLSRGGHSQGVMRGMPMTAYVPLHLNAFERDPRFKTFIEFCHAGHESHIPHAGGM